MFCTLNQSFYKLLADALKGFRSMSIPKTQAEKVLLSIKNNFDKHLFVYVYSEFFVIIYWNVLVYDGLFNEES